ncbi:7-carboxy-7-deazaguanine synthase [Clostridium polyendosporum]|uniref:7-carboxy-7-deazaguanine synthase n=1 Tax=Clostridium polyendosporum TaxID=69208 RepID=A0A919RWC3_9CLOT|nr:radical SAM protein [Clostridium polyendosporum]GIM27680.1 7-carboxy-7-deazaguanine synthase [Clostridium polyendosporum]
MTLEQFKNSQIPVVEIFKSISGEGISQGEVVTFIRTAGCNLRCSYCDTTYSYDECNKDNEYLTADKIVERLEELGCKSIICTGGEPLETGKAKRYIPLYLAIKGFKVRIETNGSCPVYSDEEIAAFLGENSKVSNNKLNLENLPIFYALDIKCPGSGMAHKNLFEENFKLLRSGDEIKFVVGGEEDINYALETIEQYKDVFSSKEVVIDFSPVFGKIDPKKLVEMLVEKDSYFTDNNIKVRLSLQIHKFIWNPETRGV